MKKAYRDKRTMTRQIMTIFFVFVSLTVWGQEIIENKLTEEHRNIKGTKLSVIPPKGFTEGLNFLGLQQSESGSSIMVSDVPGPYSEISKAITKEILLSKGIEVDTIENLTINKMPAIFVTGTQNAQGSIYTKFILLFGTELETIIINGVFPANLEKIGAEVKKSMLTAFYEEAKELDPFVFIDYSIDVSETKLKFAKNISNSLIFTVDGKIPTVSTDKTKLIVSKSFSTMMKEDKKLFSINRIKQMPVEVEKIEYIEEITIDEVSGYAIFAKAKRKTGETENVYQVILFSDQLYYILFGTTNDDTDRSLDDIKKAILTFKRK